MEREKKWVNYIPKVDSLIVASLRQRGSNQMAKEDEFCLIVFGIRQVVCKPVVALFGHHWSFHEPVR